MLPSLPIRLYLPTGGRKARSPKKAVKKPTAMAMYVRVSCNSPLAHDDIAHVQNRTAVSAGFAHYDGSLIVSLTSLL